MFERFAGEARDVVMRARAEAQQAGAGFVGTEHMLMALLDPESGRPYEVLHAAGVRLEAVRAEAARLIGKPAGPLGAEDAEALKTIGIDLDAVVASVEQSFGEGALAAPVAREKRGLFGGGGPRFSNRAKKVLELAVREAVHGGSTRGRVTSAHVAKMTITTEHILLGLIREGDGLAAKILTDGGVKLADLRTALLEGRDKAA
jgi:ATP-dependent Clp protease ATP-binding subunit ClpA